MTRKNVLIAAALLQAAVLCRAEDAAHQGVSFNRDVMAVLAKAGCNQGVCHGNQNGKGGFKLSLRGQDPRADFAALTRDQLGRRVDTILPERSLLLSKPTAAVAHQGGRRIRVGSGEYEILRRWVAAGCPADPPDEPTLAGLEVTPAAEQILIEPSGSVRLAARALFSDGTRRDVTTQAVYEPTNTLAAVDHDGVVQGLAAGETTVLVRYLDQQAAVRLAIVPPRPGFVFRSPAEANYVDRHVFAKLRSLKINPARVADDAVFLRRAYLDSLGVLPTVDETRQFLNDPSPDKRARLIDELVGREEFADWWALKWSDLLRNEEKVLDPKGVANFHHWIRQSIAQGKPLDRFVRELIVARGSTYTNPPANFYRANRDPISRAEAAAQLFLGVRLQCAKCHNHPFDRWTQGDYYRWAGFFARVRYKVVENRRRDINDGHEFDGEQIVWMAPDGEVNDPRTDRPMEPCFLGDPTPALAPDQDRLEELALWITAPDNPFFARAQANRVWYHLMGRGIVEPIDDFRATNPPAIPALLDELAADFAAHGFDLRRLVRTIMNSRTYQLSAQPNEAQPGETDDEASFSHAIVRRLSAEELLDALSQVTGVTADFQGYPAGIRAGQLPGVRVARSGRRGLKDDQFLVLFGKPPRLLTCECERSTEPTLGQAFQLVSGPTINEFLTHDGNRLSRLAASGKPPSEMVEELFLGSLSRFPTADESTSIVAYLEQAGDRRAALEDVAWSLLNSKEFLLRH
ncbi:MAG TPA: DUF1549 and DUF1553 domain-containing protein [Pirellulales bacterium]|nr:DUF1549 and DUF1553 domain-containing protein [Pirellulales bacterium]